MSGFIDKAINKKIVDSILKKIINSILECCEIMESDCIANKIQFNNHEEQIRDYLFFKYLENQEIRNKTGLSKFRFISEAPENYEDYKPKGRVDLKVFSSSWFNFPEGYFIIECKRIDGSKTLNRKYINEGIQRFVIGEKPLYSSYFGRNCMLGFVVKDIDIHSNTEKINDLQNDYPKMKSVKDIVEVADSNDNLFYSSYIVNDKIVGLYHAFYNYTSLIRDNK